VTLEQRQQVVTMASDGASVRTIARQLGCSRTAVETVLRHAEPPPAPPATDLESEIWGPAAGTSKAKAKPDPTAAQRAEFNADGERDALRGYGELKARGWSPSRAKPSPPLESPDQMLLRAEYNARVGGHNYSPLREAVRSARWRRAI
jgi:Homeodomain-like domain